MTSYKVPDESVVEFPITELFATLLRREYGEAFSMLPERQEEASDVLLALAFECCRPSVGTLERQAQLILAFLSPDDAADAQMEILGFSTSAEEAATQQMVTARCALLPDASQLAERVALLQEAFLGLFRRSYDMPDSKRGLRREVCGITLRMTELLVERYPEFSASRALLALLCFDTARLNSKMTSGSTMVLFKKHDRKNWDSVLIEEGLHHLAVSAQSEQLGPFHLEASIAAQHCIAPTWAETNWEALQSLYLALANLNADKANCLNLIVVNYHLSGALGAIDELNTLMKEQDFARSSIAQATLAAWLLELGQKASAQRHFHLAQRLADGDHERALLQEEAAHLSGLN